MANGMRNSASPTKTVVPSCSKCEFAASRTIEFVS